MRKKVERAWVTLRASVFRFSAPYQWAYKAAVDLCRETLDEKPQSRDIFIKTVFDTVSFDRVKILDKDSTWWFERRVKEVIHIWTQHRDLNSQQVHLPRYLPVLTFG